MELAVILTWIIPWEIIVSVLADTVPLYIFQTREFGYPQVLERVYQVAREDIYSQSRLLNGLPINKTDKYVVYRASKYSDKLEALALITWNLNVDGIEWVNFPRVQDELLDSPNTGDPLNDPHFRTSVFGKQAFIDFQEFLFDNCRVTGRPDRYAYTMGSDIFNRCLPVAVNDGLGHPTLPAANDPSGIVNHINTCFANAAIQALFSVPEFRAKLKQMSELRPDLSDQSATHLLQSIFTEVAARMSPSRQLISDFFHVLSMGTDGYGQNGVTVFQIGNQEDASEFIITIFKWLDNELVPEWFVSPFREIFGTEIVDCKKEVNNLHRMELDSAGDIKLLWWPLEKKRYLYEKENLIFDLNMMFRNLYSPPDVEVTDVKSVKIVKHFSPYLKISVSRTCYKTVPPPRYVEPVKNKNLLNFPVEYIILYVVDPNFSIVVGI